MSFMGMKGSTGLIIIVILASMVSASFAGGYQKFLDQPMVGSVEESTRKSLGKEQEIYFIHRRILKVSTNDYGSYDPAPTFVKPPFKLINN